jgi:ubiquinone/menaquinone biosynthesis C-methylase UbiE
VVQYNQHIRGPRWRGLIRRMYTCMAPLYDWETCALTPDYQRMAVSLLDALGITSDDPLLDLGCGTGIVALPVAKRTAWVAGIDLTPDMLRQLRCKSPAMPLVRRDVTHLPFAPHAFSVVATSFMLVHLTWAEKQAVFQGVRRTLRPGGHFGCLIGQ